MSNTINVNYMTRAYNQYQQKNAAKDQEKEDTSFADSVREKSEPFTTFTPITLAR